MTVHEAVISTVEEEIVTTLFGMQMGIPWRMVIRWLVIKELKIKGSSSVVKVGTKVKNIRLTDAAMVMTSPVRLRVLAQST